MNEPDKREKVIKGLECCMMGGGCGACPYYTVKDCPGLSPTSESLMKDALKLLQAQEPLVMTLEEIPDAVFGWMEMFGQIIPCVLEDVYADDTVGFANIEDGHDYMCASDYGKTWRVWTSRPTDEQREATPWNAQK